MFMVPTGILPLWLLGMWFYGPIVGGLYLLHRWYEWVRHYRLPDGSFVFHPVFGGNGQTADFIGGIALVFLPTLGGMIFLPIIRALCRKEPTDTAKGTAFPEPRGTMQRVRREDGSELQVEWHGPEDGMPVVLTHGWGCNRTEWEYLRRDLRGQNYRLITWDLPGLGESSLPNGNDFSLENFARDLDLVVRETCGNRPVVLAGHSIGGMTTLTFCRLFPKALQTRVAGLMLINTTYTDPVQTVRGASLFRVLKMPLIVPLQYLTILFSPLLHLSNWMSYSNGSGHLATLLTGFAGTQSWQELDFSTRYSLSARPAVMARGMLGMMRYDATEVLPTISVPTLIVTGDKDVDCTPEASEYMAHTIPNAVLSPFAPANHMTLMEHHERFAEAVSDFLSRCFAGVHQGVV